jgi:hypothetical protein
MIINFVGNYQAGYVGEISDETHLAQEMATLSHTVRQIPRDEWREHILDGRPYPHVPQELKADINIIAKWHHFSDGRFIKELRLRSQAPVFYWVWDYMWNQGFPAWHMAMAAEADLYLSNEGGLAGNYASQGVKFYYFPFDVCDGGIPRCSSGAKEYDVTFPGSYLPQGDRVEMIKEISRSFPVHIFSWNYEEWKKIGIEAKPAVYGAEFNRLVAKSRIILGFNVNAHCWGYWSNRVGKVIRAGGFLLQQYAPGMELLLGGKAEYFSSAAEAVEKISFFLNNEWARRQVVWQTQEDEWAFTSRRRVKQLLVLAERYLKEDNGRLWNQLPAM